MKCEFCGNILDPKQDRCKYCGAPCLSGHSERIDLEQHDTALKSSAEEKRDENAPCRHSDEIRPMSSPDISFLKENQKESESKNSCGCGCVIIAIIMIITAVVMANMT